MTKNVTITKLIEINAIKLNLSNPFTWASGWKSPIYCDNRRTLSYPIVRKQICQGFQNIINSHFPKVNVIAGVATGAIAHGALVAHEMNLPFVYVRSSPKEHGLKNLVEGELKGGSKVVVIEDLISTGQSSLNAVEAIREEGCEVLGMAAIFTYGFDIAAKRFAKENVTLFTLASYGDLLEYAMDVGIITPDQLEVLNQWRKDPENWGR